MGTINSSDRMAVTLYCLGTWFASGICVNTLHKGDSDDMIIVIINLPASGLSPGGSGYHSYT
jgi:hypothetical protein